MPQSILCAIRIDWQIDDDRGARPKYYLCQPIKESDRRQALEILRAVNECAGRHVTLTEIARLKMLTKGRAETEADLKGQAVAMAQELEAYPPDVVRDAARSWARREKWFPALAEMIELCEAGVRKRRDLLRALEEQE